VVAPRSNINKIGPNFQRHDAFPCIKPGAFHETPGCLPSVSTVDQTTANQERDLREIAGRVGYDIVKIHKTRASAVPKAATSARHSTPSAGMSPSGSRCVIIQLAIAGDYDHRTFAAGGRAQSRKR
jgi:hypothetical protein